MQCWKCPGPINLYLIEKETQNRPTFPDPQILCSGCSRNIDVIDGSFYHCKKCKKINLCKKCRFCDNGHALTRTVMLSNLSPGYNGNYYICNICDGNKQATDAGIWHCTPCDFDVCETCLP